MYYKARQPIQSRSIKINQDEHNSNTTAAADITFKMLIFSQIKKSHQDIPVWLLVQLAWVDFCKRKGERKCNAIFFIKRDMKSLKQEIK